MDTLTGQIVYLTPDFAEPSGGVRAMYRHVETAVAAGMDAKVWHYADGFRCGWFDSAAPVVSGAKLDLAERDLLVVPEVFVLPGFDPAPGCRKVIYNQNYFYTFDNWAGNDYPEWTPQPAVWASSETGVAVLRRLHPELPIALVPYEIDLDLFAPAARRRGRKVVLMPRKRPREAALLAALAQADERFADVELVALENLTERQTAEELAGASVFVALGHEEGFGLPVAEALAAGCVVVGYPAGGGAELFGAPGAHVAQDADMLGILDQVAAVLAHPPTAAQRRGYRDWVAKRYGRAGMRDQLLAAIGTAMQGPGSAGTATHPLAELDAQEQPNDNLAEQVARSQRFAEEQQAARDHAEQIARGLESSLRDALDQLAEQRRETNRTAQELADLRHEYTALRTAAQRLAVLDQTAALLAEYTRDNDRLSRQLDQVRNDKARIEADLRLRISDLEQSTSWRATAPLRKVTGALRNGRHG